MSPDLERLVRLQSLDLEIQSLKRSIDSEAERRQAIEARLEAERTALSAVRERLAARQAERRALEKDLAQAQARLARYKDQLMEVKTNKEYTAMQHEIAAADAAVRQLEDRILEVLIASDEVTAELQAGEARLQQASAETDAALRALADEIAAARARIETATALRAEVAASLPPSLLSLFDYIASRRGTAVVEARDGHCSVCHVRLRPKVFQDVRRNDAIIQCDSCQRILYFVPPAAPASSPVSR